MQSFSDLGNFCAHIVRKYGSPRAATEEQKADEFRRVYLNKLPPDLTTLRAVASACGIELNGVDEDRMPRNLRGYHDVYGTRRNIYYRSGDAISGIENTVLHEIREMMETLFVEVDPGYEPLRTSARHAVANRFAADVLLPSPDFRERAYETGLDVVELARVYSKSCSQVLLRMGEVLQGSVSFYGGLCEPDQENGGRWRLAYWTGSRDDGDAEVNMYAPSGFFPRKGRVLILDSLAGMALQRKETLLGRRVAPASGSEDEGLVAMARPVVISGVVVKITLLALHCRNEHLLDPQTQRVGATTFEEWDGLM